MTFTASEAEKADALLLEYHDYSNGYKPRLGYPGVSATCQQAMSSRQWETSTEASCSNLFKDEMDAVQTCLYDLPKDPREVIMLEMKSRADRRDAWVARGTHKVWRQRDVFPSLTYVDARSLIIPMMRKKCLL